MVDNELTYGHIGTDRLWHGSTYGVRLMNLHTARRCLILRIEDEQHKGQSTAALQKQLDVVRAETVAFYSYLAAYA
jgi:hypothetical protein